MCGCCCACVYVCLCVWAHASMYVHMHLRMYDYVFMCMSQPGPRIHFCDMIFVACEDLAPHWSRAVRSTHCFLRLVHDIFVVKTINCRCIQSNSFGTLCNAFRQIHHAPNFHTITNLQVKCLFSPNDNFESSKEFSCCS